MTEAHALFSVNSYSILSIVRSYITLRIPKLPRSPNINLPAKIWIHFLKEILGTSCHFVRFQEKKSNSHHDIKFNIVFIYKIVLWSRVIEYKLFFDKKKEYKLFVRPMTALGIVSLVGVYAVIGSRDIYKRLNDRFCG